MTPRVISNRIRALRFENGEMSQTELGRRIGLTRQTLAAIRSGKVLALFGSGLSDGGNLQSRPAQVFQWNSEDAS